MKEEEQRRTQCSLRSGRIHVIEFWWGGRGKKKSLFRRTCVVQDIRPLCRYDSVSTRISLASVGPEVPPVSWSSDSLGPLLWQNFP